MSTTRDPGPGGTRKDATVELRPHARLPGGRRGLTVLSGTVDAHGQALWLLAEPGAADPPPGRGRRQTPKPYDALLVRVLGDTEWITELSGVTAAYPLVDGLPDGGAVVVAPRVGPAPAPNVQVWGPDGGAPTAAFRIGDAVEHALTDRQGTLWAGYFDEGIFGDPLSEPGLVRWSADGTRLWSFSPVSGADYIADCYALNAGDGVVWACTYTGFPLLELRDQRVHRVRATTVGGPRAVAVDGDRAVFLGGYGEAAADRLTYGRLGLDSVETEDERRLVLPGGVALGAYRVVGRGDRLYVRDAATESWWVHAVRDWW